MSFDGLEGRAVSANRDRMFACKFYDSDGQEIEGFSTEYYISDIEGLEPEDCIRVQAFDLLAELAYAAKYEAPLFLEDFLEISEMEIDGKRLSLADVPVDSHLNGSHSTAQQRSAFFHFYDRDLAEDPGSKSFFSAEPEDFEQKYLNGQKDDAGSPFGDMDF